MSADMIQVDCGGWNG